MGSTLGSCLHRLPSDPQQRTVTMSLLGCLEINNPFTFHHHNPQIPGAPDAAACPDLPHHPTQPSNTKHRPHCHQAGEGIVSSLHPPEKAGCEHNFGWVLVLWGAA